MIFSAGKGCDPATFDQLKELCKLLNVSFGVTRPVYDLGWTGFERMVGQTGRTVTPRLYVALGISGSMHHVGGIKDSRRIVAVNNDSKAPIFPNADEGYRGRPQGVAAASSGAGQSKNRRCTVSKSYQAIVIGAGPAGSSAALTMARAGLDVALVERGTFPGEKNMFGGILHRMTSIEEYLPDFWNSAPLERHIAKKGTTFMTGDASFNVQHETVNFDRAPYNGYTVFRPRFDRWLAEEAVKAGATLITRATVDDLIRKDGRIAGVSILGPQRATECPGGGRGRRCPVVHGPEGRACAVPHSTPIRWRWVSRR